MDPQYIGLFGPQPVDDDYLLTDFLNANPQQSLKQQQQQQQQQQQHYHSRSSQESSPSYPSSESAGSIHSSGGSPYDYHSPPSNYHFDGSNPAAAHDLSGGYVMGISPKQISHDQAGPGMHPHPPPGQQQQQQQQQGGPPPPQGYVSHHSWDSNMSNGSMMKTPRAIFGPSDNYMSATGHPHMQQQQMYPQHQHPQSYPAHGMNPQAFSGMKYPSYQQQQQQQHPLMYSMPHFPQSNYWSPPTQAHENNNSNMLGVSHQNTAAEPHQQLKRRRVSTYDNGPVSSSTSSASLQDQQQQGPRNDYGPPANQSMPPWTSAPASAPTAASMPNVSAGDQQSIGAGTTVDANKSKPPAKKTAVGAAGASKVKEDSKTKATPTGISEIAPAPAMASKGRSAELPPQDDEGEENGPTGHNAVEKRYRTKINSSLTTLQSLIPALAHLKESDDLPSTSRKASAFILSAPQMTALPAGTRIDGVEAPSKLSKGIIIDKGIEYIAVLKDERFDLQTSLSVAEQIISEIPNGRALYDARLQHARAMASANHKRSRDILAGSPPGKMSNKRKAAMGVFGGVGLFGAGAAVPSWTDASNQAASSGTAWAGASHLAKRASEAALPGSAAQPTFGSTLGWVATVAWLVVFAYYIGQGLAGAIFTTRPQLETASARDDALRVLSRDEQPTQGHLSKYRSASKSEAARRRNALLVLSQAAGYGTLFCGVVGSLAQGLISYSHRWIKHASIDVNDPIEAEKIAALVRLTELETSFGAGLCHRVQRLHSILRLHNAFVRMPKAEKDLQSATPELAAPRIEATLSLALVSIFSSQASKLSRRRRFWQQATTPSTDEKAAGSLDPWLLVALGADYEEACVAAFKHSSLSTVASPSDYCPLLRVAEHRCMEQLTNIWARMFVSAIQRANSGDFQSSGFASSKIAQMPFDDGQAGRKVDQILASTVKGSPVQQLAILTRGFWSLGTGDIHVARQHAAVLLTDLRQGGHAAEFASIPIFINLMLPFSTGLHEANTRKPKSTLDTIAVASLEWLSLRRQYTKLPEGSIDARFYDSTLTFRKILNNPTWSAADVQKGSLRESFFSAQSLCIQLVEVMGRRAAGMSLPCDLPSKEQDSGSEESG